MAAASASDIHTCSSQQQQQAAAAAAKVGSEQHSSCGGIRHSCRSQNVLPCWHDVPSVLATHCRCWKDHLECLKARSMR